MKKNTDYTMPDDCTTFRTLAATFLIALAVGLIPGCHNQESDKRQGYDDKVKEELLSEGFILKNEPDGSYKVTGRLLSTGHFPKGEYQITVNPDRSLTIFDGDRFVAEVTYPSGKDSLFNLIIKDASE